MRGLGPRGRIGRRAFLRAGGAAGLVGLAGCSGGGQTGTETLSENQFYWSASDYEQGANPEDSWTAMAEVTTWSIEEDDHGKHLSFSGPSNERSSLRFSTAGTTPNPDIRATMKATGSSDDFWVYTMGNNEDTPSSLSCYRAADTTRNGVFRLGVYDAGSLSQSVETMDRFGGPGERYHVRARYQDDTWQAKWWPHGQTEPTDWSLEMESSALDPGYVGLGHWTAANVKVYEFTAGMDGSPAPELQHLGKSDTHTTE